MEIDARALLPAENQAYGFDNIADLLTFSPGLLERYLSAARLVSRMAVGDPTIPPDVYHHSVPTSVRQDGRMSDDLPFGSQGGMAFRYQFPAAGEYLLRVYLQQPSPLVGQEVDLRLDGELIAKPTLLPDMTGDTVAVLPKAAEVRFTTSAGSRLITATASRRAPAVEGLLPKRLPMDLFTVGDAEVERRANGIVAAEIEGPFNSYQETESDARHRLFICEPTSPADEAPAPSASWSRWPNGHIGGRFPVPMWSHCFVSTASGGNPAGSRLGSSGRLKLARRPEISVSHRA